MSFRPATVAEAHTWLREKMDAAQPVALRGGDSRGLPTAGRPVLRTGSLDQVLFFEPDDMVIGVGAGMKVTDLLKLTGQENMGLPLDPWYDGTTVGSLIAFNDHGPRRLNTGGVRDAIIGLEYINGHGQVVKSGGRVVKNVTGYDLAKLHIGARGAFGLITSVNFKLLPLPVSPRNLDLHYEDHSWLRQIRVLHKKMLPWDEVSVYGDGSTVHVRLGYSGNAPRAACLLERMQTETTGKSASFPLDREGGVVSAIRRRPEATEFTGHLHLSASTGFLLQEFPWQSLDGLPCRWIAHPIGGDVHFFVRPDDADTRHKIVQLCGSAAGGLKGPALPVTETPPALARLQTNLSRSLDPARIFVPPEVSAHGGS